MSHHQPLGVVARDDGRLRVQFERHVNHDRARVWRALTESEHLRSWMPCDIVGERRAGARIELPFWPDHVEKYGLDAAPLHGEIRVWDPPSVFEWTWETDVLRWELTPERGGTHLRFTHRDLPSAEATASHAHGWEHYLGRLMAAASGSDPGRDPWLDGEM